MKTGYTTDQECMKRYKTEEGTFKSGFEGCVRAFTNCSKGVKSPDKLCAFIGRSHGKIGRRASFYQDSEELIQDLKQEAYQFARSLGEIPRVASSFAATAEGYYRNALFGSPMEAPYTDQPVHEFSITLTLDPEGSYMVSCPEWKFEAPGGEDPTKTVASLVHEIVEHNALGE